MYTCDKPCAHSKTKALRVKARQSCNNPKIAPTRTPRRMRQHRTLQRCKSVTGRYLVINGRQTRDTNTQTRRPNFAAQVDNWRPFGPGKVDTASNTQAKKGFGFRDLMRRAFAIQLRVEFEASMDHAIWKVHA